MNQSPDLLADRVSDWTAETQGAKPEGEACLRGWALLGQLKRRGPSAGRLVDAVESRLGNMPYDLIPAHIERAHGEWVQLLADLDREEENFEHVRRAARDVFFSVLEALILAEESGESDAEPAARRLFNAVANDLYAFEPMADVAAELERRGHGKFGLSDLLCTGVARLFDGQAPARGAAATAEPVADFVPLGAVLKGAGESLNLAALGTRLRKIEWWYVKWAAQRVRVAVMSKARNLGVYVWEGDGASLAMSTGMDGWEVRAGNGRDSATGTIKAGSAVLGLPQRIDSATFAIQVKSPGGDEWHDLFARAEVL